MTNLGLDIWFEHGVLDGGRHVREQHVGGRLVVAGKLGRPVLDHAEHGVQRAPVVHVHLVLARPVERLAVLHLLEALQAEAMLFVERDVLRRKIATDHADQLGGGEKARRHGRMARGAAQQARIFNLRGLDRIKGGGANNKDAHAECDR
jgi:hypothetical protein